MPDDAANDTPLLSRRALIGASATSVLLAGCLGDGGDDDSERTDTGEDETGPGDDREPNGNGDDGNGAGFDREALGERAREFVELLAAGAFETAESRVDPAAVGELSATTLESAWKRRITPLGDMVEVVTTEFEGVEGGIAGVTVAVRFEDGVRQFDLDYSENGVAGFFIPETEWTAPGYVDRSAFVETELALDAPGDCSLGATLTLPERTDGNGQVPGVVIVHGNGPLDRDGTVGPNRTYRELAEGLSTEGIAVLRYDKRTLACSVDLADVTIDDVTTDDALTAVARLREHDRVGDVFVAGHSFGGLLAPRIAERDGTLAGVVMLAPGPARPMADAIVAQQEHLLSRRDLTDEAFEAAMAEIEARAEQIATLDIGDDEVVHGLGGREYYETLAEYDHTGTAAGLDVPVRILQGAQDWQVTLEDLGIWEAALSGKPTVEVTVYDDLNHRFQHSEGPMTRTEYFDPGSAVDERVVDDVAAFVRTHD